MNGSHLNLDRLAAERAQAIIRRTADKKASEIDNTITKSLGVLQENGVYACFLYLLAKEKGNRDVVVEEMLSLLDALNFGWGKPANYEAATVLKHITDKVTIELERLLMAKETLEKMLIYSRYGAKARD
jgi:hypothetical protein